MTPPPEHHLKYLHFDVQHLPTAWVTDAVSFHSG
jgi:hypothetical protein